MKLGGYLLLLFLIMPVVSATIVIDDDFDHLYNVGDLVEVNFSVIKDYDVSGFVEALLDCGEDKFVLKKDYVSLEEDRKKYIYLESPLAIEGDCRVVVSFLNEEERSVEFEVSDKIEIDYTLNDRFFLPYEKLIINGTVEKESGEDYDGLLKVEIVDLDEKTVEVIDGDFSFEYEIREDSYPKEYLLKISVEERDFRDKIINSGTESENIEIRPKATSIKIEAIEAIVPPYEFNFTVALLDQIERVFDNETIIIKLWNPLGNVIFKDAVLSGEMIYYNFSGDAMKGCWNIKSYYENIVAVKPVCIDENKEINSSLVGNVLYFENLGNVIYDGIVNFTVNKEDFNETIYFNISVGVGEIEEYVLNYEGEYNFSLNGKNYGLIPLTGNFILGEINFDEQSYFVAGGILVFLFLVWFFVFKKKVLRSLGKKRREGRRQSFYNPRAQEPAFAGQSFLDHSPPKQQTVNGNKKEIKEIQSNKLIVKEIKEEDKPVVRKNYMLFLESSVDLESFRGIIEKYGFKLNLVEEKLGYVLFFESKNMNSELKAYNLAKTIMRFSGVKNAKTSIVINRGIFENKLTLLKKFALLNRKLLVHSPGKILMTKKFFDFLKIGVAKDVKKVRVLERDLEICLV